MYIYIFKIYVYTYMYIYIYIHTYKHTYMHTYIHTYGSSHLGPSHLDHFNMPFGRGGQ